MPDPELQIRQTPDGLVVGLHVQPRAKRCEIAGVYNGALKVKITAPPVDDAANRAIVEYLASRLGVSKSKLCILSGSRSRDKVLQIKSMSLEDFKKRLNPDFQK